MPLLTVGHGTLDQDALGALLSGAGIELLVDVRRFPGSRRWPHVGRDVIATWLPALDITYRWVEDLGGRRSVRPDSPHIALRNESFRGYADHMSSDAFRAALRGVTVASATSSVAVMCSESLWWRCHRRLIADYVTLLHDTEVRHLLHDGRLAAHAVTDGARRAGDTVIYDLLAQPTLGFEADSGR